MTDFAAIVYLLGAATSLVSALLLARGYKRTRVRLLMWCSLFFTALVVENVLLFLDMNVLPNVRLVEWRHGATLTGLALLLFGLIWDVE